MPPVANPESAVQELTESRWLGGTGTKGSMSITPRVRGVHGYSPIVLSL